MKLDFAILAAMASLAIAGPATAQQGASGAQGRIFESGGIPNAADSDSEEFLYFSLWDDHVRFRVRAQPGGGLEKLETILLRSLSSGQSIRVLYDAAGGRVDRAKGKIDFPLCRATIDDLVFEPETPCPTGPAESSPAGETALAFGYAYSGAGDYPRARAMLDRVRATDDPAIRKLLLRIHGDTEARSVEEPWTASGDRAYVAALADYRELAALEPDDVELQLEIASILEELGAYRETRSLLDLILKRWPEQEFRVAVRIGAIHRRQGDYASALAQLDDYVARSGSGEDMGMKFHYHRGWTLTRMGRFDEAVADFDAGIARQPDFAYAYFMRSCAQASRGRLSEALADVGRGRKLLAELPFASTKTVQFDIRRADAVAAQLDRAIATHDNRPMPDTCKGYWGHSDEARQRSPLLPAD